MNANTTITEPISVEESAIPAFLVRDADGNEVKVIAVQDAEDKGEDATEVQVLN